MAIVNDTALLAIYQALVFAAAEGATQGLFLDLTDGADNFTLTANASGDRAAGVRALGGSDTVVGGGGTDVVNGNAGTDALHGGDGNDYLRGGRDNDNLWGGNAIDVLNGNLGDDTVNGEQGNDYARGGQGNDLLLGGNGNDILLGDFGRDTLQGDDGADVFVLRADSEQQTDPLAADLIADFTVAEGDRILLVGTFGANDLRFELRNFLGNSRLEVTLRQVSTDRVLGVVQDAVNGDRLGLDTTANPFPIAASDLSFELVNVAGGTATDVIVRQVSTNLVLATLPDVIDPNSISVETAIVPFTDPMLALG